MGIGDEIMASGHALAEHRRTGKRVLIVDLYGRPRWSELWQGLPWIATPKERGDFARIKNGAQCRPYIAYPFNREIGQRFTSWRARDYPGHIALTAAETTFAAAATTGLKSFVVIEPHTRANSNPNKQWGWKNWQALAAELGGEQLIQIGPRGTKTLRGVRLVETPTFRHGAAVMARAAACVLPEGGLHHAAGVLGVPAVVLFGGTISPDVTGYPVHLNIASGQPGTPCGTWKPCAHCARGWQALTPGMVADALQTILDAKQRAA